MHKTEVASHYQTMRKKHAQPSLLLAIISFLTLCLGAFFLSPTYRAPATLTVKNKDLKNEWDLLKAETQDTDFEEQILSRAVLEKTLKTLKLMPSPKASRNFIPEPVRHFLEKLSPKNSESARIGAAVDDFKKDAEAERIKHSLVLKVSVKAKTPQQAADYSNALVKSYIRLMKSKETANAKIFIKAVDSQLLATAKTLEIKADARKNFLSKQGWDDYLTDLQHSKAQVAALKNSLRFLTSYEEIKTVAPNSVPGSDELGIGVQGDSSLDVLNRQLSRADNQLSDVSSRHSSESLGVLQARFEREWLDSIFRRQAGNVKERRARIEKQLTVEQKQLETMMLLEPKAKTIEGEFEHLEKRYQELLHQKAQAEFALSVLEQSPDDEFELLQVLDAAIPPLQRNPVLFKLYFIAAAFIVAFIAFFAGPILFELLVFEVPLASPQASSEKSEPDFFQDREKIKHSEPERVTVMKAEESFNLPKQQSNSSFPPTFVSHRQSIYGTPSVKGGFREDIE